MTDEEIQEIARQLSHPNGEMGVKVAEMMNISNINMTRTAIEALQIQNDEEVLELGHGNCGHLSDLLKVAKNVQYKGVEISELMHVNAIELSKKLGTTSQTQFQLYEGQFIPHRSQFFDKIFTVNTIYFWKDPVTFLNEIYRVLKPKGLFCICYSQASYMEKLPFTQYGFELYDHSKIQTLIAQSRFSFISELKKTETVQGKIGDATERDYSAVILQK